MEHYFHHTYVLYTGNHFFMAAHTNDGPAGTRYAVVQNGYMITEAFIDWFLIPYLLQQYSSIFVGTAQLTCII